jgi:hypothetical protein
MQNMGELLKTTLGKVVAALVVVSLLLGIAVESVSLVTGYYNMGKARDDRTIRDLEAQAKSGAMESLVPHRTYSASDREFIRQYKCITEQDKKNLPTDVCFQK